MLREAGPRGGGRPAGSTRADWAGGCVRIDAQTGRSLVNTSGDGRTLRGILENLAGGVGAGGRKPTMGRQDPELNQHPMLSGPDLARRQAEPRGDLGDRQALDPPQVDRPITCLRNARAEFLEDFPDLATSEVAVQSLLRGLVIPGQRCRRPRGGAGRARGVSPGGQGPRGGASPRRTTRRERGLGSHRGDADPGG